jgi:antitoxin (DNA-binding transcriptional repressor) of toxin-antitoxin stability system
MKTATVRDLRNNFAELAKHIEWGEQISITRNGRVFATLSPAARPKSKRELAAAWKDRLKNYKPVGRRLSKAQTDALWSRLRD